MKLQDVKNKAYELINTEGYESINLSKIIKELQEDNRKSYRELAVNLTGKIEKNAHEIERVSKLYEFDINKKGEALYIAGLDEVGRGPLAGPIVACSVILNYTEFNKESLILGINDSKKLSPKERERLSELIKENCIAYSIAEISNTDIDKIGIGNANQKVFKLAVEGLKVKPEFVLCDGYAMKDSSYKNIGVVKGDTKSASIACASIIAKVYRDNLMKEFSKVYKGYGFDENAGYGTKFHIDAIKALGPSPIHRRSFLNNILLDNRPASKSQ